ncbi:MAG: apolipoprotein N-acyltransferase [Pseudobdellovibrionaceae bacterium]
MMKALYLFIKSKDFLFALFSGILIGTSYIPFYPWAIFFAYIPLWLKCLDPNLSLRKVFALGWTTQFVLTLIGFHWVAHTAHEFGQIPWILSVPILFVFCSLMHLYLPLSLACGFWLSKKLKMSRPQSLMTFALLLILAERSWPSLFPWHLGYTFLWAKWPVYQWADTFGFWGLSSWILLTNALLAFLFLPIALRTKSFVATGLTGFWLIMNLTGTAKKQQWTVTDQNLKVSITQANIGNAEKIYAEKGKDFQEAILQKFVQLTDQELLKTPESELIVWPETAVQNYLDDKFLANQNQQYLLKNQQRWNKTLITGAYSKDEKSSYNALFFLPSNPTDKKQSYNKTYLLAFGEYMPFSERFPVLLKLFPFISNFGRGPGPSVFYWPSKKLTLGLQICYEGLFADFSRRLAMEQSQILVNVTNDSWFGEKFEPWQHGMMTFARAIEVRRPLIRSTNTGVSTVILANGDILQKSPLHQEWTGSYDVPYLQSPELTTFTHYGYLDFVFYGIALMILLIYALLRRRKN